MSIQSKISAAKSVVDFQESLLKLSQEADRVFDKALERAELEPGEVNPVIAQGLGTVTKTLELVYSDIGFFDPSDEEFELYERIKSKGKKTDIEGSGFRSFGTVWVLKGVGFVFAINNEYGDKVAAAVM